MRLVSVVRFFVFFFFQAEDGIRDYKVTGVQTCALPICADHGNEPLTAMFPTLKTGAVMQYPAKRTLQFNTDAIRFLDGTEQRFRDNPSVLHRWTIQLDLLDESELAALDQFFISNQGRFGSFSFTDS